MLTRPSFIANKMTEGTISKWTHLPSDILAKCVVFIEHQRLFSSPEEQDIWTRTLRSISSTCRHWRSIVKWNLQSLRPRCPFQWLPVIAHQFPNLQFLDLKKCRISVLQLRDPVADMPDGTSNVFNEMTSLMALKNLKGLELRYRDDRVLKILSQFSKLNFLYLGGYLPCTPNGIANLASLQSLTSLIFDGDGTLKSLDYAFLSSLNQLRKLWLLKCHIDDDGLQFVSGLRHLTDLNLFYCKQLFGAGFSFLSTLVNLKYLNVAATNVTTNSFIALSHCQRLTSINASFCPLLLPQEIGVFCLFPLQTLRLIRCDVLTLEAVLFLKEKLENCEIHFQKSGDIFTEQIYTF